MLGALIALALIRQDPVPESQPPPVVKAEVANATPEQAIRTLLVAMVTKDSATLRAVCLPADDLDTLLRGAPMPAEALAKFKSQIADLPAQVPKAGEEITLPDGRKYAVGPGDIAPDRAVVMLRGTAFPVHCRRVDGRWRVDAAPIIASLKPAAPARKTVDPSQLKDKVSVVVGSKSDVLFDRKGDALSAPKVVEKPADGSATVHIEFSNQGKNLMLSTQNPFPKGLAFRALARHKGRKNYVETSIVPVKAGLFGLELWQEPIEELVLFDFKLVADEP